MDRYLPDSEQAPDPDALVDNYLSEKAMRRHDRGCPLPWLAGEVPRMPPAARARFQTGIGAMQSTFAKALRAKGFDAGTAEDLAASIVAEMVGAMALARAMGESDEACRMLARSREAIKQRMAIAN